MPLMGFSRSAAAAAPAGVSERGCGFAMRTTTLIASESSSESVRSLLLHTSLRRDIGRHSALSSARAHLRSATVPSISTLTASPARVFTSTRISDGPRGALYRLLKPARLTAAEAASIAQHHPAPPGSPRLHPAPPGSPRLHPAPPGSPRRTGHHPAPRGVTAAAADRNKGDNKLPCMSRGLLSACAGMMRV